MDTISNIHSDSNDSRLLCLCRSPCCCCCFIVITVSVGLAGALAKTPPNPKNPFAAAMQDNIYLTKNYYIGAYHYIQCWGQSLVIPSSTAEVANAISYYYNKTRAKIPVTLRASRPKFHSSANFPCPNSPLVIAGQVPADIARPISVGLLHQKMNKVLAKDYKTWTMRVGAGMRYTEFLKEATKAGMSVVVRNMFNRLVLR